MKISHLEPNHPTETVIQIEGLRQSITLMHVTDSHLEFADDRDPDALELIRLTEAKRPEAHKHFIEALARSNKSGVDATILTGDITNFPSWAAIDTIANGVATLSTPYLFTFGNHDWHFPFMDWNDATRDEYYHRFAGLIDGDPQCQVKEIGGVKLIALDNSNYQITMAQMEFLEDQLRTGAPCLLFIHIPIFVPSLLTPVLERWKTPLMMAATEGWTAETRAARPEFFPNGTTLEFHRFLIEGASENIAAIFCGHVHFSHADAYRAGRFQYVTNAGFDGDSRLIRLKPY
ncbi:MAG: metallophosphoesterase [Candidatus Poribacteria bacterium]|nr:metallophosphoesterase [Candidatus Poribacteria bacterium]MDE0506128.1 metallophosphoesterase [Candidatus Poribacteria bacterium]